MSNNKQELDRLRQRKQYLERLHLLQASPEFQEYKRYLFEQSNRKDFGNGVCLRPYAQGLNPEWVAVQNEQYRFHKEGILHSLTLLAEDLAETERQISQLTSHT